MNRLFKISAFVLLSLVGLNTWGQKSFNPIENIDFSNQGDTIKIVRNGDTTTIINDFASIFKFDTTILLGNDTDLLNQVTKVFASENGKTIIDTTFSGDRELLNELLDKVFDGRNIDFFETKTLSDNKKKISNKTTSSSNYINQDFSHRFWSYDVELYASFGFNSWSRMNDMEDFFSSPEGNYEMKFFGGEKWRIGFTTKFFPKSRLSILTGLTYESNIFRFKNDVLWSGNSNNRIELASGVKNSRNERITARYVTLPLIFQLDFGKRGGWTFNFGAIGGLNFRTSYTGFKRSYEDGNASIDESWGTNFKNFSFGKVDAHVGFSYKGFELYMEQSLTPIFKSGTEKQLYPFSLGISIGL